LLIATDAFAAVDQLIAAALTPGIKRAMAAMAKTTEVNVHSGNLAEWSAIFRVLQGAEISAQHGAWIDRYRPEFGPGIRERFAWTRTIDPAEVATAKPKREAIAHHMDQLLGDDAMICLPTAPGAAPKLNTPPAELEAFRNRAFALLSIAGLARLPQINLPVGTLDGYPIGLSIIGPRGSDRGLLDWVATNFG
jgi:amidase